MLAFSKINIANTPRIISSATIYIHDGKNPKYLPRTVQRHMQVLKSF